MLPVMQYIIIYLYKLLCEKVKQRSRISQHKVQKKNFAFKAKCPQWRTIITVIRNANFMPKTANMITQKVLKLRHQEATWNKIWKEYLDSCSAGNGVLFGQ